MVLRLPGLVKIKLVLTLLLPVSQLQLSHLVCLFYSLVLPSSPDPHPPPPPSTCRLTARWLFTSCLTPSASWGRPWWSVRARWPPPWRAPAAGRARPCRRRCQRSRVCWSRPASWRTRRSCSRRRTRRASCRPPESRTAGEPLAITSPFAPEKKCFIRYFWECSVGDVEMSLTRLRWQNSTALGQVLWRHQSCKRQRKVCFLTTLVEWGRKFGNSSSCFSSFYISI